MEAIEEKMDYNDYEEFKSVVWEQINEFMRDE